MRLTRRERRFLKEAGNALIFGHGANNVQIGAEDGTLKLRGEYKGKWFEWTIPRIDFHYPRPPRDGASLASCIIQGVAS